MSREREQANWRLLRARDLMDRSYESKGATGFCFGLTTEDCQKTYATLEDRGVEFTDEPTQRPYGIDCGARDPFGNHFRIVQYTHG